MFAPKDKYLGQYKGLDLYQIRKSQLPFFSDFVFKLYSYHYAKKYDWQPSGQIRLDMRASDEKRYYQSVCFGFKNEFQDFVGTIKVTYKTEGDVFPIEEEFHINLPEIIQEKNLQVKHIWHLGRLAIDSKFLKQYKNKISSKELITQLVKQAFLIVDKNPNSLVIAESDALIYTIFREIGINMQKIGPSQECLGSPTYPVIMTGPDIRNWLKGIENNELSPIYH